MSVQLRTKALSSGKKSYYLDIYFEGQRDYEFLRIYTAPNDSKESKRVKKQQAESIRAMREIEVNEGRFGLNTAKKSKADFIKFFQNYIDNYKGNGYRKYTSTFLKFQQYHKKSKLPFHKLTPSLCKGFYDYLETECGLARETPLSYFKSFKAVINDAVRKGELKSNPALGFKIKKDSNDTLHKQILTKDELQILVQTHCGNDDVKRAFLFACNTGVGKAEIDVMTWDNIRNGKLIYRRNKTTEQVIVPLSKTALKLIGERGEKDEYIFDLPSDTATNKNLRYWIKRAALDKHITFYCARHTFAVQLLLNGANLKTVADLLGHTTTKHTLKYLNYVDELKDEAINKLPELNF